jgi:tRNA uracil 4-sulfurtransferase
VPTNCALSKVTIRQQKTILIHYSEIGLKGRNQPLFRRQLRANIRQKLRALSLTWTLQEKPGFLQIAVPPEASREQIDVCVKGLREVFGVAWFAVTEPQPHGRFTFDSRAKDLANLEQRVIALAKDEFAPNKTFCVRVKRAEKAVPLTSVELENRFGRLIIDNTSWKKVDLDHPDALFQIEIRPEGSFLFSNKLKGPSGLPVGTAGRVLTLLSGGIDSPVAAYLMAKRGCRVDFLHFTATSMQQDEAREYKVWRLAEHLSRYTLGSRLFLVPYTQFDVAVVASGQQIEYDLVLFRRFMARVAEAAAMRIRAQAIVTGDNLAQVASQTLSNIVTTSQAVEMPILRPLIAFNKEEIINLATEIGTYEESIKPYKDCCAIISRHPRTRSRHATLTDLEQRLFPDYQKLIDETLKEMLCIDV